MWERRSRVTGSTVWYSSSMPSVKDGRMGEAPDAGCLYAEGPWLLLDLPADFFAVPFLAAGFFSVADAAGFVTCLPGRNEDHTTPPAGVPACCCAFSTAISATASTIQRKFASPTEWTSASGAGFMKSMA